MLYQFRACLFRQWNVKAIMATLKANPGLAKHFEDCHKLREKILGTLREAYMKQSGGNRKKVNSASVTHVRSDTLINLVEEYLPMLDTLISLVDETLGGKIKGLETVWTSILTESWETKALSDNLAHERMQILFLLAQAVYMDAAAEHRDHRTAVQSEAEKEVRKGGDDVDCLKSIMKKLQRAAGIWNYLSDKAKCYPIRAQNMTPECFQDIPKAMATLALANAQEFMVQIAVEGKKSNQIVAKLAEGVSLQLTSALKTARTALGSKQVLLNPDIQVYLDLRASMYHAIALKYQSKVAHDAEEYGERIAILKAAQGTLGRLAVPVPKDKKGRPLQLSPTLQILQGSIRDQRNMVAALLKEATEDNENVYHYRVPATDKHNSVDHIKMIKPKEYTPPEPKVILLPSPTAAKAKPAADDDGLATQMDALALEQGIAASLAEASKGASAPASAPDIPEPAPQEGGEDDEKSNKPSAPSVTYV